MSCTSSKTICLRYVSFWTRNKFDVFRRVLESRGKRPVVSVRPPALVDLAVTGRIFLKFGVGHFHWNLQFVGHFTWTPAQFYTVEVFCSSTTIPVECIVAFPRKHVLYCKLLIAPQDGGNSLFSFHNNNGYLNAPHCYFLCRLPALFCYRLGYRVPERRKGKGKSVLLQARGAQRVRGI